MPTINFEEIECYNPRGIRDDVRLSAACDGNARRTIWQERMREGNRINRTARCEPVVYCDTASIRLSGDYGYNLGSMHLDRHSDTGSGEFYFPGDLNSRYRIAFRIDPEPASSTHGLIRLIRLDCNDAQGAHDKVTLTVNGIYVLDRHEMKTRWHVDFDDEISFNSACTITLSESYLENWSRSFTLRAGEYRVGDVPDPTYEFDLDRGITGSARYTLTYRMLE